MQAKDIENKHMVSIEKYFVSEQSGGQVPSGGESNITISQDTFREQPGTPSSPPLWMP